MKIAMASGKGGTGKTTLATNLASFWSRIHPNLVLVDLDVEEPNSGLFIQGELISKEIQYREVPIVDNQKCTLCGRCKEICQFNAIAQFPKILEIYQELCHSCHACIGLCPHNALLEGKREIGIVSNYQLPFFRFVESRMEVGEPSAVPLIRATMKHLEGNSYGLMVIDAPPGTACPVVETFRHADLVILVTEPTPFGLHDLKLAVDTARKMGLLFGVVINKDGIGDGSLEKYLQHESIPIFGKIPYSKHIAKIYSEGKLILEEIPWIEDTMKHIINSINTLMANKQVL